MGTGSGTSGDVGEEGSEWRRGLKTSTMTRPKMISTSKNMQLRLPVFFWYLEQKRCQVQGAVHFT